ncbi:MAG TPA: hypothetical protein VLT62_30765 [Candidatus Methylomirabilis sp.]|nr:hypothetical protein [Candidatus Methylomirabilis sp.]
MALRRLPLKTPVARVCRRVATRPEQIREGSRRPAVSHARTGIADLWVEVPGQPGRPLASLLGAHPQAVYQAVARGQAAPAEWDRFLET